MTGWAAQLNKGRHRRCRELQPAPDGIGIINIEKEQQADEESTDEPAC